MGCVPASPAESKEEKKEKKEKEKKEIKGSAILKRNLAFNLKLFDQLQSLWYNTIPHKYDHIDKLIMVCFYI